MTRPVEVPRPELLNKSMQLVYIDESGINQGLASNGRYKDGPYIIWSSILIPEQKYFHLERLFYDLAKNILGVSDWQIKEIHATDIWGRTGGFSTLSLTKAKKYFEELFQLVAKMNLQIVFSIQQKNSLLRSKSSKEKEVKKSIYAFLHGIEYKLSKLNETGVLIADKSGESNYSQMQLLLLDRTKWRNLGKSRFKMQTKYRYESLSCFILDQVNYTDSNKSLFIQLEDSICFVIQRVFTYMYLKQFSKIGTKADINLVPITSETFKFFFSQSNPLLTYWDDSRRDITLMNFGDDNYFNTEDNFLSLNLTAFTPYK